MFFVSAKASRNGLQELLEGIAILCQDILDKGSVCIPSAYKKSLSYIQSSVETLLPISTLHKQLGESSGMDFRMFECAIHYFHSIGRVVCLSNGVVCTNPVQIPQMAAKFISPENVRMSLLKTSVQILDSEEIACILQEFDSTLNPR